MTCFYLSNAFLAVSGCTPEFIIKSIRKRINTADFWAILHRYKSHHCTMSPGDLDLLLPAHRKRSSGDTSEPPEFESEKSPTKKVRFILNDNLPAKTSIVIADNKARTNPNDNEPSSLALSLSQVPSEIPDLRLPENLGTLAHTLGSSTNTLNEETGPLPLPPPSPHPRALDLPLSIGSLNGPLAPTIPALTTACRSGTPSPDSPYNDRPRLDEDLLVSQIKEFTGIETDKENPYLAQAQRNVQIAKVAYQLADFAMGVARGKKISVRGDAHMANIVSRAVARLRAATEKQKEIMAGGSDVPNLAHQELVKSSDERDDKGNVWCLGMLGTSMRNHCCSDCENLTTPNIDFNDRHFRSL